MRSNPKSLSLIEFNSVVGLMTSSECNNCTAGQYCGSPGLNRTSGPCEIGYYCPERSSSARQIPCGPGAYCPAGSRQQSLCEPGTFQPNSTRWLKSQCQNCTQGRHRISSRSLRSFCNQSNHCLVQDLNIVQCERG